MDKIHRPQFFHHHFICSPYRPTPAENETIEISARPQIERFWKGAAMSSRFVGLGLGVLAIGFSLASFAMADKLKPQDVPAKIRDTAMKRLPGAKIDSAEKE